MYKKVFDLYSGTHTTLDIDVAEQLWFVYLPEKLAYFKEFLVYMDKLPEKETMKVHKDLWNMMIDFSY